MTPISLILASESVRFPKVKLAESAPSEYAHIVAEVDEQQALFLPNSWRKRQLIEKLQAVVQTARDEPRPWRAAGYLPGSRATAREGSNVTDAGAISSS